MTEINAAVVKELREMTNLGMMECKKALVEANGDKEKALKILKEKGLAVAEKRSDRDALDGVISILQNGAKTTMIKVSCETDFVGKTDNFINLVKTLSSEYDKQGDAFLTSNSLKEIIAGGSAQTGEKLELKEAITYEAKQGFIESYLHTNKRVGVLIEIACDASLVSKPEVKELGKDLTMQIAALSPLALSPDDISDEIKNEQREIFKVQMNDSGKPADVVAKIIEGKLGKHLSDLCLVEMPFVKDGKLKVKDLVAQVAKKVGGEIKLVRFKRMQIGK
jgi:elongation factor Ts